MPRVSAKRQITLPIDQCREVGIGPGDEYRSYVADGRITIVRKTTGAARGILRHAAADRAVSDEESLQDRARTSPDALIAVDTSVLLRYLLHDDDAQAARADAVFDTAETVLVTDVVLVETVWTLSGRKYRLTRPELEWPSSNGCSAVAEHPIRGRSGRVARLAGVPRLPRRRRKAKPGWRRAPVSLMRSSCTRRLKTASAAQRVR